MGSSSFHSIPLFWMSCHKPAWREKCSNVLVDGGDKEKGMIQNSNSCQVCPPII